MTQTLAVDIGGTKVVAGLVDRNGKATYKKLISTPKQDAEDLFQGVKEIILQVLDNANVSLSTIQGISIGVPGLFDYKNGIAKYQSNIPWDNFPIVSRLQQEFPGIKIMADNDVYMASFGQWYFSDIKDDEVSVFLTVSTGISSGVVQHGELFRGGGTAGEIGHVIVKPNGPECNCGRVGCLEALSSGSAIQKIAQKKIGKEVSTEEVLQDFKADIGYALDIVNNSIYYLAYGIHIINQMYNPTQLIMGGGVINNNPHLVSDIEKKLLNFGDDMDIHLSKLKGDAGLIGAGLRLLSREN